jgi:ParB family chromosome partitioning protein
VQYELIAGERRLRASKIAGLREVPVVIRTAEDSDRMKLELAIIENLQREDLNALDRAKAFRRLTDEFGLKHIEIGVRVGKSREYVSNTLRMLLLPEEIQQALEKGEITEGHTRPLLMLADKPAEQLVLYKEVVARRLTVRDTEAMARRVAIDKVRHKSLLSPDLLALEKQLSERLGTRVRIEKKDIGGKLLIDFFSPEDLSTLCLTLAMPQAGASSAPQSESGTASGSEQDIPAPIADETVAPEDGTGDAVPEEGKATPEEKNDPDLYSIRNFSL